MMKNNQTVSRKDVAALAGVTETIVSYVLNNNRAVKKEKREAVLNAVKQLNYKPNRFARALKGKSSKHILLLLDRIRTEVAGELITEIDRYSEGLGYMISISIIENSEDFVKKIIDWQVDGVIISSIYFDPVYIQELVDSGIAVVVFQNRYYKDLTGATIINTGLSGGTNQAIEYLYKTNCRKIAYVDRISQKKFSDMSDVRFTAYKTKIEALGLKQILVTGCRTPEELIEKLRDLFKNKAVDGLFCRNDEIACICLNAANQYGISVPEELSVIGLDDITAAKTSFPPLTTIRLNREGFSKVAVTAIENTILGRNEKVQLDFNSELIVRESTRKL